MRARPANWAYFMSRCVIYASLAAFSPRGNEMVITTFAIRGRTAAAAAIVITPLMWEIVRMAPVERNRRRISVTGLKAT